MKSVFNVACHMCGLTLLRCVFRDASTRPFQFVTAIVDWGFLAIKHVQALITRHYWHHRLQGQFRQASRTPFSMVSLRKTDPALYERIQHYVLMGEEDFLVLTKPKCDLYDKLPLRRG